MSASVDLNVFNWTPSYFTTNEEMCLKHLQQNEVWNSIPLLSTSNCQYHENMKLVRFRGMIQDMYEPEFYFEQVEVVHQITKATNIQNGKYIDILECGENEVINMESAKNVTKQRNTYVVISVPGLNTWAEILESQQNPVALLDSEPTACNSTKRSLNAEEGMETEPLQECSKHDTKKHCATKSETDKRNNFSKDDILNHPIPRRSGKTCIVKTYENSESLQLNQLVEFVGFLSTHPLLGQFDSNEYESQMEGQFDSSKYESEMEVHAHHPPPSLVPRVHCVTWKNIEHNNPLLHISTNDNRKLEDVRKELLLILTQLLLGDELAAEYLICHLISKVYLRNDMLALGKFSLNISHIPLQQIPDYVRQLYNFIEMFLPKSHYLPMTLENIAGTNFIPKKNYEYNRLNSGLLQLSRNTHLVLDETKLTPGRLNTSGVQNVRAISNVIRNQKAQYDFNYYQMEFECDIPVCILSEGKSFLPSDFHVPLQPDEDLVRIFPETLEAIKKYVQSGILNNIRIYLTQARHGTYELPEGVHELIGEEFVQMRKTKKTTAEDLHNLLVLVRLQCLSQGQNTFSKDCWQKACNLENSRKERLEKLKA